MPALTSAERQFLSQEWRWSEIKDSSIKVRHPGAREAEIPSAFVTLAGASAAVSIIALATARDRKMVVATCDGILPVTFRGRPTTVRLMHARFGIGLNPGRLMLLERADTDYTNRVTTLYLTG